MKIHQVVPEEPFLLSGTLARNARLCVPMIDNINARLATLDQLLQTTIPAFLTPPPSRETLRNWFDDAGIPRFKANPSAPRGGGPCFYSVAAVEKFFRSRTLPGGAMVRARSAVMG